uniref:(California timema) hypothetical protein n=1 Tax=Timema californicum TaxID=61474 RepID=A0A7R9P537_TIMCA|nr:unnamed protein product [Timema californicum]
MDELLHDGEVGGTKTGADRISGAYHGTMRMLPLLGTICWTLIDAVQIRSDAAMFWWQRWDRHHHILSTSVDDWALHSGSTLGNTTMEPISKGDKFLFYFLRCAEFVTYLWDRAQRGLPVPPPPSCRARLAAHGLVAPGASGLRGFSSHSGFGPVSMRVGRSRAVGSRLWACLERVRDCDAITRRNGDGINVTIYKLPVPSVEKKVRSTFGHLKSQVFRLSSESPEEDTKSEELKRFCGELENQMGAPLELVNEYFIRIQTLIRRRGEFSEALTVDRIYSNLRPSIRINKRISKFHPVCNCDKQSRSKVSVVSAEAGPWREGRKLNLRRGIGFPRQIVTNCPPRHSGETMLLGAPVELGSLKIVALLDTGSLNKVFLKDLLGTLRTRGLLVRLTPLSCPDTPGATVLEEIRDHRLDFEAVLAKYPDVICDRIGHTNVFSHSKELVDHTPKFVWMTPLRVATSNSVVDALNATMFRNFGYPHILVSDNASQFTSKIFEDMCFNNGIKHVTTTPYYPQPYHVERFHRNLKAALISFHHIHHKDLDKSLTPLQIAFKSAEHDSHRKIPSSLILGHDLLSPINLRWEILPGTLKDHSDRRIEADRAIDGKTAKLDYRWSAPTIISKFLTPVTVQLMDPVTCLATHPREAWFARSPSPFLPCAVGCARPRRAWRIGLRDFFSHSGFGFMSMRVSRSRAVDSQVWACLERDRERLVERNKTQNNVQYSVTEAASTALIETYNTGGIQPNRDIREKQLQGLISSEQTKAHRMFSISFHSFLSLSVSIYRNRGDNALNTNGKQRGKLFGNEF